MINSVHIVPKLNAQDDPLVLAASNAIKTTAHSLGIKVIGVTSIRPDTLIVAVGGDGTMLEALRRSAASGAVALGVNLGNVGFLTEISVIRDAVDGSLAPLMRQIFSQEIDTFVEYRTILTTSPAPDHLACNEISVSHLHSDTMITYHLRVGRISAGIHKANSILISTPTGSTAYSLAAGGALMMPDMEAIQIVPVAPLTLTSRPLMVGSDCRITIEAWGGGISVRSDGQTISVADQSFTADTPYVIEVYAFPTRAKMLHLAGWNYFNVLSSKLGWIKR